MKNQFVSEEIIDKTAAEIGASEDYFKNLLKGFQTQQPHIFAYVLSESFAILTQEEKEYLLYLTLVVWKSTTEVFPALTIIEERDLGEKEELSWKIYEETPAKTFRDKLTSFFENHSQEDLLAFAEDALVIDEEDDENPVTKEGRAPMFIALFAIIDCLVTKN